VYSGGTMIHAADPVTLSIPRTILTDLVDCSADVSERMHALLERNADGALSASERAELTALVRIAEFGQVAAMALL
jgi:hypothetical protein